jgi:transposase
MYSNRPHEKEKIDDLEKRMMQTSLGAIPSGWKQKEIGKALGVTKGAVSQWILRDKEDGSETLKD